MIRITISVAAYAALATAFPSGLGVEQNRAPNGDYFIWLDSRYVARPAPCAAGGSRGRASRGRGMIQVEVTQTPWHFTTGLDLFDHWQTVIAGVFALVAGAAHANRGAHTVTIDGHDTILTFVSKDDAEKFAQ